MPISLFINLYPPALKLALDHTQLWNFVIILSVCEIFASCAKLQELFLRQIVALNTIRAAGPPLPGGVTTAQYQPHLSSELVCPK